MNDIVNTQEFREFVTVVSDRIDHVRLKASKAFNSELIRLYWTIGKDIVERQAKYSWGKSIVEDLAFELRHLKGGSTGFSARNLWRMRNFYVSFPDSEILPPLVAEISWTKIYVILEKCKDVHEREFYFRMTRKYGWTKDVLVHNISIKTYERYLTNQTNFSEQLPQEYRDHAELAVKDEYTFDFMELSPQHSEKELESFLYTIGS